MRRRRAASFLALIGIALVWALRIRAVDSELTRRNQLLFAEIEATQHSTTRR